MRLITSADNVPDRATQRPPSGSSTTCYCFSKLSFFCVCCSSGSPLSTASPARSCLSAGASASTTWCVSAAALFPVPPPPRLGRRVPSSAYLSSDLALLGPLITLDAREDCVQIACTRVEECVVVTALTGHVVWLRSSSRESQTFWHLTEIA